MFEAMIERRSRRAGLADWLRSIWRDGERKRDAPESAEMEVRAACRPWLGCGPNDVAAL